MASTSIANAGKETLRGTVKTVGSADTIHLIGKPNKAGEIPERTLYLAGVHAPKLSDDGREEPFAFEAREAVRGKVVGKAIDFTIEYTSLGKDYGRVWVEGDDLAYTLVKDGLAYVDSDLPPKAKLSTFKDLQEAEKTAKAAGKGVWNKKEKDDAHIRKFIDENSKEFSPQDILNAAKDQKLHGIVESCANGVITVYVPEHRWKINIQLPYVNLPILGLKHGADLKKWLEIRIGQRDVKLQLQSYDDKTKNFVGIPRVGSTDIVLELLKDGWARLTQSSVIEVSGEDFPKYKAAQESAQNAKLRIWDKYESKKPAGAPSTTKSEGAGTFPARVVEVHSGDSMTIINLDNGKAQRIFLPNIRAPAIGNQKRGESDRPFAFEAKEYVRKQTIGKKVNADVEFTRTIKTIGDDGKETSRALTFASIFVNDKNLGEMLLEQGLATVNMPRVDEEFTKHLKGLTEAADKGKASKLNLYAAGGENPATVRFSDYTMGKSVSKAKKFAEFLDQKKKLSGLVEVVLNGARYKVRLNEENCYVLFMLNGVRALENDKNIPEAEVWSNKALQFAKENILQRDIDIEIEHCDNRGIFHGSIYVARKNWALTLLENGLVFVDVRGKKQPKDIEKYRQAEEEAKAKKVGLWSSSLNLTSLASKAGNKTNKLQLTWKVLNEKYRATATEITDATRFYLQNIEKNQANEIDAELADFDESKPRLEPPIKKGTPCVARFPADRKWYRARIVSQRGTSDKYQVSFYDFGNVDDVEGKYLKKCPAKLLTIPPQARECALAWVRVPDYDHGAGEAAHEFLKDLIWDQKLEARFAYEAEGVSYCTLIITGAKNAMAPETLVQGQMIAKGYARVDPTLEGIPTEYLETWEKLEAKAKKAGVGIWGFEDVLSEAEEEEDDS